MHHHHLVAGEARFSMQCPNCLQEAETLDHILWHCSAWAAWRELDATGFQALPQVVQTTWLPLHTLTQAQGETLRSCFFQAVRILEQHTQRGAACIPIVRRRVTGKRATTIRDNGSQEPPRAMGAEIDFQAGGHDLVLATVQGRRSLQCRACNMRSTLPNRIWFVRHACADWVRRRRDRVPCPLGMRDLVHSETGVPHCVCLWCGAADKQRSNLIRRHACWEGSLRQAITATGRDLGGHIDFLCGLGGQAGHVLSVHDGNVQTCVRCGISGRSLRFHPQCHAFNPITFGLSEAEWREGLLASSHLLS